MRLRVITQCHDRYNPCPYFEWAGGTAIHNMDYVHTCMHYKGQQFSPAEMDLRVGINPNLLPKWCPLATESEILTAYHGTSCARDKPVP